MCGRPFNLRSKRPFFSMGRHTHPQLSRTVAWTESPYPQGREFKGYLNYGTDKL